ncbi:hypothetical protein BDR06DRAFT_967451 [Suillus hirtellus]|nr:hypothetical protein BDR06DRAFT_967451 [Suillus hirtellus]
MLNITHPHVGLGTWEVQKCDLLSMQVPTCARPPDTLAMSSDASHVTVKIHQDHPSNLSNERPLKHPHVQLRVCPDPHCTPALSLSEHLASRARQKCRGVGTSFSVSAAPGLLLGAKPVASCPAAAPTHLPIPDGLIAMDPGKICIKKHQLPVQPRFLSLLLPSPMACTVLFEPAAAISNSMQCFLDALDVTSHKICLHLVAEEHTDKGMNDAYTHHIHNYAAYWDQYQAKMVANNSTWTSVPALPISAAKQKLGSSDTISRSNIDKSVIQKAISALEDWWMSHHHLYLRVPEDQVWLHDDNCIRQIKSTAKHDKLNASTAFWGALSQIPGLMLLYGVFSQPVPAFDPEFLKAGYGKFGHWSWYNLASGNNVKAIDCWRVNDAFANCYDHALPLKGLLGTAMFNARKPEQYFLDRDHLKPPSELLLQIFPWIEQENAVLQQQEATLGCTGCDIALKQTRQLCLLGLTMRLSWHCNTSQSSMPEACFMARDGNCISSIMMPSSSW